ncbi:MAG: 2-oxoacid:acceptor oxidoreductase family protein [Candidatus Aminicenantales bacterium]|jgi:2-oxoacid:acceptor oxidoreductase gamma subunit (pyruvate/2-ketoisovalerate family)
MIEIRFHGRGGQGTVMASKILADAIAKDGKYVQAYPEFGVERRGAPVFAFIRIDDKPIYDKSKIYTPDHVVVLEPTLVEAIDLTEGLKPGGTILINTDKKPGDFKQYAKFKVAVVDATGIAIKNKLGTLAAPIINTAITGAVVKIFRLARLESLFDSIREAISLSPEDNVRAAQEAFERVVTGNGAKK